MKWIWWNREDTKVHVSKSGEERWVTNYKRKPRSEYTEDWCKILYKPNSVFISHFIYNLMNKPRPTIFYFNKVFDTVTIIYLFNKLKHKSLYGIKKWRKSYYWSPARIFPWTMVFYHIYINSQRLELNLFCRLCCSRLYILLVYLYSVNTSGCL